MVNGDIRGNPDLPISLEVGHSLLYVKSASPYPSFSPWKWALHKETCLFIFHMSKFLSGHHALI